MPSLDAYLTTPPIKGLLAGHSGAGKTCSLVSLIAAGYPLCIVDLESSMAPLASMAAQWSLVDQLPRLTSVQTIAPQYSVVGEKLKADVGSAPVWSQILNLLMNWPGLGPIYNWPSEFVLVIDSLTALGNATLSANRAAIAAQSRGKSEAFGRDIGGAQDDLASLFDTLRAASVRCSVIITCHMEQYSTPDKGAVWFPNVPGKKLSPAVASFFDFGALLDVVPGSTGPQYRFTCLPNTAYGFLKSPAGPQVPQYLPTSYALGWMFERIRGTLGPSGLSFGALNPQQQGAA